jgi:hypothetical protein
MGLMFKNINLAEDHHEIILYKFYGAVVSVFQRNEFKK